MKFCTQCGAKLSEGVKFCTQCGNPIQQPAPTPEPSFTILEPTTPATSAPVNPDPTPYIPPVHATPQKPKKAKKKSGGGKIALLVICIVLALAIAGGLLLFFLGGGLSRDNSVLGLYDGVSYRFGGMDMSIIDDSVELKPFGIAKLTLSGDNYFAFWSLDDEDFLLKQGGNTYEGTLEDGVLTLDLGGLIYTYVHEDAEPQKDDDRSADKDKPAADEDQPAPDAPAEEPAADAPTVENASIVGYWALHHTVGDADMTKSKEDIDALENQLGAEIYLELYEDGTGVLNWEELSEITWGDGLLIAPDDSTTSYFLEDGMLVVDIVGTYFYFTPGEGIPGELPNAQLTPYDLEYYEGDYYGWWSYADVIVGDPEMEGAWWDCCMSVDLYADGTGTLTIWDEDYGKDDPLAVVDVTVSVTDGVARFASEEGQFMGYPVEHADWLFYSDDTIYENAFGFYAMYADSEAEIECYFFMRPWGIVWDDADESDLPYYYSDWYLPLIEEGVTEAPGTIG